ncbi:MAG: ornithine cyclodeaminase [Lachnospiraceae bacterium]|nr:ornithine cyclodeaminase [Lachnospiraceae bacterium]
MKIITFDDIKALNIDPVECYRWVDEMLRDKDSVHLPPKISMKQQGGIFCNVMPCIVPNVDGGREGVKLVTRYPSRVPALDARILLMDSNTGEFMALMDGTWITGIRTGAVAAHTIMTLAKKDFTVMGFMGLGNTARATMLILANLIKEREITVKLLRYKDQAESFAERFKEYQNFKFVIVDTPEEMIKGSEVVVSAVTVLKENVCANECFDEGVLVVPIHTMGFINCDTYFDKIYGDDYGHICHFGDFNDFPNFAEVADVLAGRAPGRENDKERILAYNIGLSIHDIFYASKIYDMLKDKDLPEVELDEPAEKFWV